MSKHQIQSDIPVRIEGPVMGRRQAMAALAAAAAAAGLPGIATAQGAPRKGGVLKVASPSNPSSLDPATGRSGFDHIQLYTMFDTLFEWDYQSLSARPGLCKSWKFTDPKTLVMELEAGVTFHDGTPLDAAAVKFNLDRCKNDQRSNLKADVASVDAVEVTGPLQVTLKLKQPDTALVLILSDRAGMMFSPKALQAMQGSESDRKPVGAGAWKFVSWTDNEKVVVTRNDKYWRKDQPLLDGIEFSLIPEVNTGLRSVIAGQNQFAHALSPQQKPVIDRAKGMRSLATPTLFVHLFFLNYGRAPLDNPKVRRAMNFAIDREAFNKATQAGIGEAANTLLPKAHWAHDASLGDVYKYDPEYARKLLAEAGHPNGLEISVIGWNDQRSVQRQEILIEQMGKAGFRLKIQQFAVADATAQFFGADKKGDVYLAAWTGRPDPSLTTQLMFAKESYFNAGKADPAPGRAEAQLETQAVESIEERKKAFAKLQRIVAEHSLFVPIVVQYDLQAMTDKVQGYTSNLLGKPKFEKVWLQS
ncbi:MAG TPA: ABC transporter substrate-binding protein [Quisquiliibacterium sp.]|nr:ABC transporter substrate-binding protein [Quisquiliibacterium sp.]